MRNQKDTYCFITDEAGKFYIAQQRVSGDYRISSNSQPYPISFNPTNLKDAPVEFGTNEKYFSLNRSVSYSLNFIKDGAAILRQFYHQGKGKEAKAYLTIIDWNGTRNLYELTYFGKFAFREKEEDPKSGMFSVPCVDDSAWGVLQNNDSVQYAIECNERNPKAIRVLFDGMTLVNKYTFQTVQAPIVHNSISDGIGATTATIPFVLINQDGDSVGIVAKSQNFFKLTTIPPDHDTQGWFFSTAYAISNITVEGSYKFQWNIEYPVSPTVFLAGTTLNLYTTEEPGFPNGRKYPVYNRPYLEPAFTNGSIHSINFNITGINLSVDAKMFLVITIGETYPTNTNLVVTPIVTNIVVSTRTTTQSQIAYGLRPLDLLQTLVSKATNGRFTINSLFFAVNNKDIAFSGDSLRNIPNAKIYSSVADFFETFSSLYWMAFRTIIGQLWMEKAIEVYKQSTTLLDIGDAIDVKLSANNSYDCNEVEVGSPDVDLRHPSGRLEFNTTNTFSLPVFSTKKKYEIVTKYRLGCFDIIFLILDYKGDSTQDNSGDKTVYLARITDQQAMALENIETFENVTIDNAVLEPIIKSPRDNDSITYDLPIIKGIAPAGSVVNIYVDTVLDGSTITDLNGNWVYTIVTPLTPFVDGVTTGIHIIDASFGTLLDPISTINIVIDTSITTTTSIVYPEPDSNLYNNLPLIRGVAQQGVNFNLILDGVILANLTGDNSCKWEYKMTVPISNGAHTLIADVDTVNFNVDSNVSYPLITYIGSELDGFLIVNNLPLIQGVALPGTVVQLWLNYINFPGSMLGTAIADSNGNWSYQVVPVTYIDPISGIPIVLAPIQNGLNIISTSLINHLVSIQVVAYKLERPAFSSIQGVTDNTVFNTAYTSWRMMIEHFPLFASILAKQPNDQITFQTSKKNSNLRTVLGGVTISENDDIPVSIMGAPLMLLETAKIKTKVRQPFAKLLENFNNGGVVKVSYRGTDLFCLPIGSMKMSQIHSDVQDWELLMSPLTSYSALLNLYKNGIIINLMKNTIYHSDYNTLHFVSYNFVLPTKYHVKDIYDDWFNNRNNQWLLNPDYIQKMETGDPIIRDQIIANGVSNIVLRVYDCKNARLVDTILYNPVFPTPINPPEVVLEALLDLSIYPPAQYFTVLSVAGTPVAISERFETRVSWPGTILIEASNSINMVGFFFSTGILTQIRVEGHIKKLQSEIDFIPSKDESGNTETLYSNFSRERMIRFGTARGLPDYLYLKIVPALLLDQLEIEGVFYDLKEGENVIPSDDIDGHPLFYYQAVLTFKTNAKGMVFPGNPSANRTGVIIVVDATAFGLPVGSLINIDLINE